MHNVYFFKSGASPAGGVDHLLPGGAGVGELLQVSMMMMMVKVAMMMVMVMMMMLVMVMMAMVVMVMMVMMVSHAAPVATPEDEEVMD